MLIFSWHTPHVHGSPEPALVDFFPGEVISLEADDVIRCCRIPLGASLAVLDIDRALVWLPSSLLRLLDAVSPDDADMLNFVTGKVDRRAYIVIP